MITRFDKALAQVARASDLDKGRPVVESRAQKVRRLEELIRAKEASGDRIVIGIGAALVVSAMALPVYAAFLRDGSVYLPGLDASFTITGGSAGERSGAASPSRTDLIEMASIPPATAAASPPRTQPQQAGPTPLSRYVIHQASEGSALIEGPNGLWWVTPGMTVPGAGHILSIERSEAGWAVLTSETTITEAAD